MQFSILIVFLSCKQTHICPCLLVFTCQVRKVKGLFPFLCHVGFSPLVYFITWYQITKLRSWHFDFRNTNGQLPPHLSHPLGSSQFMLRTGYHSTVIKISNNVMSPQQQHHDVMHMCHPSPHMSTLAGLLPRPAFICLTFLLPLCQSVPPQYPRPFQTDNIFLSKPQAHSNSSPHSS